MKAMKIISSMAVLALLICFSLPASAKVAVPVNVFGQAGDGAITDENYTQVLPNGTNQIFTLPTNKMLIFSSIFVSFSTTTPFTPPVKFVIEDANGDSPSIFAWNLSPNQSNTNASLDFTFQPGLALSVKPVMKVVDSSNNVVSGTLKVRVFGIVQ